RGRAKDEPPVEPAPVVDAAPRRTLPEPEPVYAYPPLSIYPDGVGPYLLGKDMREVLRALPEGPRLELVQLGGFMNWHIARSEAGKLLLGPAAGNQNRVGFVAVLGADVARTATGVGVGSTGAELAKTLGKPEEPGDVLRDRRIERFERLPGVRFLTDAS